MKGYGIHGTNVPSSIGRNASHGCIRMRNHDVEELFEIVAVGDAVELHHERTPETERIFGTVTLVAHDRDAGAAPARRSKHRTLAIAVCYHRGREKVARGFSGARIMASRLPPEPLTT